VRATRFVCSPALGKKYHHVTVNPQSQHKFASCVTHALSQRRPDSLPCFWSYIPKFQASQCNSEFCIYRSLTGEFGRGVITSQNCWIHVTFQAYSGRRYMHRRLVQPNWWLGTKQALRCRRAGTELAFCPSWRSAYVTDTYLHVYILPSPWRVALLLHSRCITIVVLLC
jgi:hypothetical protein